MNAPLTPANLQRAAKLIAEMERIESELRSIFGSGGGSSVQSEAPAVAAKPGRKTRNMSAAGRARIAAAQRARWAKQKEGKGTAAEKPVKAAKAGKRGKRVLSPEARAKIAAAQKRRWAKQKAK